MFFRTICCLIFVIINLREHFSFFSEDIPVSEREKTFNKHISDFLYAFCTAQFGGLSKHCHEDLVTNFDLPNSHFVKIITNNEENQTFSDEFDAKIFFFDVRVTEDTFFNNFKANYFLNRRATFIFLQEKLSLGFFEEAEGFFIKPIYVIEENLNIYVVDPFKSGNASIPDLFQEFLGSYLSLDVGLKKMKAPRKIKKWPNTTLNIFYRNIPPWVEEDNYGIEQNILRVAAQFLQMKNKSIRMDKIEYQSGKNSSSGRYHSKILRFLLYGKSDVGVGSFFPTLDIIEDFEGSVVYEVDTVAMVSSMPKVIHVWKRVLTIYSNNVPILYLIFMTVTVIFIQAFYKHDLMTTFTWFFQITVDSSILNIQRKANFRLILASYMLFCLVNSTAFKNTLQLIYFSERYEEGIHTRDDALYSGLKLYVFQQRIIDLMKNSTIARVREATKRMEVCKDVKRCFHQVAYNKNAIVAFPRIHALYVIPKFYIDPLTNSPLLQVGDPGRIIPIQMIFRKFYPPLDDINWALSRILEGGIYNFECRRILWDFYLKTSRLDGLQSKVLKLRHLLFVVFIWAAGLIIAFLTFMTELVVFHFS